MTSTTNTTTPVTITTIPDNTLGQLLHAAIQRAEAAEAKLAQANAYGRYCAHVTLQRGASAIPTFTEWLAEREEYLRV